MSKKVIGVLLALALILSVFSFTVFADEYTEYETDSQYTQTWKLENKQKVSDGTYKVDVRLTTNYLVGPVQFKLLNVKSVTAVAVGSGYYQATATPGYTSGLVLLTPNSSPVQEGRELDGVVVATVTYKADSDVTPVIENKPKNGTTPGGTLFAARLKGSRAIDGNVKFVVGQTAEVIGLDGTSPEPPATNVTLTGVNGAVVDTARGYVYGIPANTDDVKSYFTTTGYIEMVANEVASTKGTGATLNLYKDSSKSSKVASYTLVIFGDVNGDGALTLEDAGEVGQVANYLSDPFIGAYAFAADVNCDAAVTLEDAGTIGQIANYLENPITNPWA